LVSIATNGPGRRVESGTGRLDVRPPGLHLGLSRADPSEEMSGSPTSGLRHRVRLADDAGLGMIEVIVSMVLLTMLALATLSVIDQSTAASAQTRSKSLAADIAHDDLNRMRQLKFDLVSGVDYQSKSTQNGVDGVQYTVVSTAAWATDSGVETSCTTPTTAGNSSYLRIRSTVTWPNMTGSAVVADSIMAPRGKEANRTTGSLMVKVQDRNGASVVGATVNVASQTLVTSAAGCVYFPAIAAGQWPVSITKIATPYNYMDSDGNSPGAATASVVVGDVSTVSVSFDIPQVFNPVTFYREDNTTGPKWYSITATGQSKTISYPVTPTSTAATSFPTAQVFPYASGWAFYAGRCAGNNPAIWTTNATAVMTNTSLSGLPGATITNARAYLRKMTFNVKSPNAETLTYRITPYTDATYTQMTGCESPPDTSVAVLANTNTAVTVDVPYGLYGICVENGSTNYSNSAYRWTKYSGTNGAPVAAYHAMPSVSGITLKPGSPPNDTATPTLTVGHPSNPSVDQCT
jgi:Tfp pilus assembly protein PilV